MAEKFFAFHLIYQDVHQILKELRQIWNMSGSTAKGVDLVTIQARRAVKDAIVWRLPIRQQRIRVLGVPIGREEYVKDHLAKKTEEPQVLIDLPLVQDLPAWLVVFCCAGSWATFWLRSVRHQLTADFSDSHRQADVGMFQSFGWDCELFSESTTIHHDSLVTRTQFC